MIPLSGPSFVEAGSTVCITATNIGSGFSAIASSPETVIKLKVTINPQNHTAELCFTAPAGGSTVTVHVSGNNKSRSNNHTVIVRR